MTLIEGLIVAGSLLIAGSYLSWRVVQRFRRPTAGCGCGSSCPMQQPQHPSTGASESAASSSAAGSSGDRGVSTSGDSSPGSLGRNTATPLTLGGRHLR